MTSRNMREAYNTNSDDSSNQTIFEDENNRKPPNRNAYSLPNHSIYSTGMNFSSELFKENHISTEDTYHANRIKFESQGIRRRSLANKTLMLLEEVFQKHNFPSKQTKIDISIQTGYSLSKVKNWFQNRRAREKKIAGIAASLNKNSTTENRISEIYPTCNSLYMRKPYR